MTSRNPPEVVRKFVEHSGHANDRRTATILLAYFNAASKRARFVVFQVRFSSQFLTDLIHQSQNVSRVPSDQQFIDAATGIVRLRQLHCMILAVLSRINGHPLPDFRPLRTRAHCKKRPIRLIVHRSKGRDP